MTKIIQYEGAKISKQGVYAGVPIDEYHGDCCKGPSVSKTSLWTCVKKSFAHYFDSSPYHPDPARSDDDSKSKMIGRACHHLLLGQGSFKSQFIIRPEKLAGLPWQGNRKECKIWLADQKAKCLQVVTQDEVERIVGMANALKKEPLVTKGGILNGAIETSIFWQDKKTGLWVKVRPDALPGSADDAADLKTCESTRFDDLQRAIYNYGYFLQAGLTAMAWPIIFDRPLATFTLVFVESKRPFCTRILTLKPYAVDYGVKLARQVLDRLGECFKTGVWPGPGSNLADASYVDLRDWDTKELDYLLESPKHIGN